MKTILIIEDILIFFKLNLKLILYLISLIFLYIIYGYNKLNKIEIQYNKEKDKIEKQNLERNSNIIRFCILLSFSLIFLFYSFLIMNYYNF